MKLKTKIRILCEVGDMTAFILALIAAGIYNNSDVYGYNFIPAGLIFIAMMIYRKIGTLKP